MIQYGVIGKENNVIVGDWENYIYVVSSVLERFIEYAVCR